VIEGYVIDWTAVAAIIAALAAIGAAYFSYLSAKQRTKLDAALEICRFKKTDLKEFKKLADEILPLLYQDGGFQIIEKAKVAPTISKMLLLLNPSNPKHIDLSNGLLKLIKAPQVEGGKTAIEVSIGGVAFENLLETVRFYVLEERKQIVTILETKNNA
jgi:hypothetical protein